MQKKRENKKPRGKEESIYKVCSIEPRDKMPTYSRVQWESQSAVVRLTCFGVFCVFYLWKGFKHKKERERAKAKKSWCWLVVFTLKKEFEPLLSVLICKKKKKTIF